MQNINRMKTIKTNVYELAELTEAIQEKVITNTAQLLVAGDWFTPITEGFREKMESFGLIGADPYFSGFWSQGDGACFVCDQIDTDLLIRTLFETEYDISQDIVLETKNMHVVIQKVDTSFASQYDHENTICAHVNYEGEDPNISKLDIDKLENVLTNWAREISKELYKTLEKYYDECSSEEAAKENLEGCIFFKDGRIANGYEILDVI